MFSFQNSKVVTLITFGFLVHTLILKGVFDIYFSSPIDHGMKPIKSTNHPPAKRLVFFVADGLRAEAIFEKNRTDIAPNLNNIRKNRGSWGVSHTRVPTESRPGHVALLGGIYEDPSALLKGWKVNPVDFDSVINQSTNAWCWGGPSIVNMFNKDNLPHIHLHSYSHNLEDFGNNNTIELDSWVFEHVQSFIEHNKNCKDCRAFRQSGNLFFLHLLGIDTSGHAFKPESEEYAKNIKFVDGIIPKIENLFEEAFPDNSTAYVFTADHGMTNWGSHGAGSHHETETPLIAWGAGIKKDNTRKDVKQIDIAPFLSALIGVNYPINSLGRLPSDYFNTSMENLSEMMISNVRQLIEIFNVKRYRIMGTAIRYVPFLGIETFDLDRKILHLRNLSSQNKYDLLKIETERFIEVLIQGADYYHNYYQLPLLIAITMGTVQWIIYLATFNINLKREFQSKEVNWEQGFIFGPLYIITLLCLYLQSLPVIFYIYFLFPIVMLQIVLNRFHYILEAIKQIKNFGLKSSLIQVLIYILGLRLLVQGFRNRENYSIVMFVMIAFMFFSKSLKTCAPQKQKLVWICCCFVLSIFPLLPVMKTTFNVYSYITGFVVWWKVFENFIFMRLEKDPRNKYLNIQHTFLKLTPIYTLLVEYDIITSDSFLKNFAWIWAITPILIIPKSPNRIFTRLTSIFLGFGPFYLMVTSNYENFFLIWYILTLLLWLTIESKCFGYASIKKASFERRTKIEHHQTSDDFRRAFFFVVFIFVGFFGTGNIASLNSFDPMWVRCFLTVFSPFKMAGLILLRIIVPFIFTSCVYRAVNLFRQGNTLNMFCIVLMFSDLMLLELLFYITNIGSWLEIGMNFSQFIIMEAFVLILLLLYGFAYFLTTFCY